ncbi:MAG: hypothetical protein AAFQ98_20755 [Bacteroidota bacterium]
MMRKISFNNLLIQLSMIFSFSCTSSWIYAQPIRHRTKGEIFEEYSMMRGNNPSSNLNIVWSCIDLCEFPDAIDMYTPPGITEEKLSFYPDSAELFEDINLLIQHEEEWSQYVAAEARLTRGILHYYVNQYEKALGDYFIGLAYLDAYESQIIRKYYLKRKFYVALAALYYHKDGSLTDENARQALLYLDKIDIRTSHEPDSFSFYLEEKKELLRFLNREEEIVTHYKSLIQFEYQRFLNLTERDLFFRSEHYYHLILRAYDLVTYYQEIGDHKKSDHLVTALRKLLPPKSDGQLYTQFPTERLPYIMGGAYAHKSDVGDLSWDYETIADFIKFMTTQ